MICGMQFEIDVKEEPHPEHNCYNDNCDAHIVAPRGPDEADDYHYNCPECDVPYCLHLQTPEGIDIRWKILG